MIHDPSPEEHTRKIVDDLIACLSLLAASDLPAESIETVKLIQQKMESLSQQILASHEKLHQDLRQAEQERNNFISVVTHELRLPMTSIKGYTDLLRQGVVGPVNEQQLSFLDTIRNNVDRMAALLSDLSDISRIDTGRLKLDIAAQDIESSLDTAMERLKPLWEKKEQTVEILIPNGLPPVSTDHNRLVQVITNLLRNAIMYTPNGGRISIRADHEDEQLRIEVADNGIGIKPEDQARLFGPFFRSDDIYVRDQPGWGISLHVSSKLIRILGGGIGVYSDPGTGSKFWFTLPVHKSN